MLVTTITTAVSFLANLSSPISAMKAFGIFTAMVVLSDFFLMMMVMLS